MLTVTPKKPIDLTCLERYVNDPSKIHSLEDMAPVKAVVNGSTTAPVKLTQRVK